MEGHLELSVQSLYAKTFCWEVSNCEADVVSKTSIQNVNKVYFKFSLEAPLLSLEIELDKLFQILSREMENLKKNSLGEIIQ